MPPTGVALQDARARLFDAADRVVLRDGASALTSRAVTEELGVAKGVLHRHFPDFDTFLAEWVVQKTARLRDLGDELNTVAGTASVGANLRDALARAFCIAAASFVMFRTVATTGSLRPAKTVRIRRIAVS